jgi:hypothetical protein
MDPLRKTAFSVALLLWLILALSATCVVADSQIFISAINPAEAYPSETLHIYGGGATPESMVTVKLAGIPQGVIVNNLTLGSTVANQTGDWRIDSVVPLVSPGNYSVQALDDRNIPSNLVSLQVLWNTAIVPLTNYTYGFVVNATWPFGPLKNTTTSFLLFYAPLATVPTSGPFGTIVTISGHSASGGEIDVYFNNTQVATVLGQPPGSWITLIQVPNISPGNYTIRAIDAGARMMSISSFYVTSGVSSSLNMLFLMLGLFALAVFSGVVTLLLLTRIPKRHDNPTTQKPSDDPTTDSRNP